MSKLDLGNLSIEDIERLNRISSDMRREFTTLTESWYSQCDGSVDWLVGSTLSRNPYLSPLFLECCHLAFVDDVLGEGRKVEELIVPSDALAKVLKGKLSHSHPGLTVNSSISWKTRLKLMLTPGVHLLRNLSYALNMRLARSANRRDSNNPQAPITLMDTFILPSSLSGENYNDRYYPGLLDLLSEEEKSHIYFFPHMTNVSQLNKKCEVLERSGRKFLFSNDYLCLSDYIYALTRSMRVNMRLISCREFRGYNISSLLRADFKRNSHNPSSFYGLLNYRFMNRLSQAKVKVRRVIDWSENQVIDRGLIKGVRDFYPGVKIAGYQGYIISKVFNFYIQPAKFEVQAGIIPDEVYVVGEKLVDDLREFCDDLDVKVAPAYRFRHVMADVPRQQQSEPMVFVPLPVSWQGSCDILSLLQWAVAEGKLHVDQISVKPHPTLPLAKLKAVFPSDFVNGVTWTQEQILECYKRASLVVSNTSSVCVEALAFGIPVIVVGSSTNITQNPIPGNVDKNIWSLCYTKAQFFTALSNFLESDQQQHAWSKIGEGIKQNYFASITRQGTLEFLNIN